MRKLHGLDLFSGIGGNSLGLGDWIDTLAYCEQDRYAQAVLLSRMSDGILPMRPIWDDVRTLRGENLPPIDIIVGGFPCQDISCAGRGAGLEGQRSGLFFEIVRLAQEIQPAFLFLENVPAIRTRGAARVVEELSKLGYDCRWTTVSAAEVGAHHKRERWFILAAHSERLKLRDEQGRSRGSSRESPAFPGNNGPQESLANSEGVGEREQDDETSSVPRQWTREGFGGRSEQSGDGRGSPVWPPEPDVGRVANGVSHAMDRLKCLGNAVVPAQACEAFKRLMGLESEQKEHVCKSA